MAKEPIRGMHPPVAKAVTELQGMRFNPIVSTATRYVPVAFVAMSPGDTVVSFINDPTGTPDDITDEITVSNDQGMGWVLMNAANAADTVTILGAQYDAVSGTPVDNTEWDIDGAAGAEAISLAAAINSRQSAVVTAVVDGAYVVLTAVAKGDANATLLTIAEGTSGVRISVSGATSTGAAGAIATGTLTCASVIAGNTVTVNGHLYTAVLSSVQNVNNPAEFNTGLNDTPSDNECAQSLRDAINLRELGKDTLVASTSTNVTTVNSTNFGTKWNAVDLAQTGGTVTVSGALLTGGVNPGGNFWASTTTLAGVPMLLWLNKDDA